MSDHPLSGQSAHPMRRKTIKTPVGPASSCFHCYRPGIVSPNQTRDNRLPLQGLMRFDCTCGHTWLTDRADALAHGRFLQRIDVHPSRDV